MKQRQVVFATLVSVALFLGLTFGLRWHVLLSAALALPTYLGVFLVAKPKLRIGSIVVDDLPEGGELRRLMDDAYDDMEIIRRACSNISNTAIQAEARKLYRTGSSLLEYLTEQPEKIRLARRFLGYYLDTSGQILAKYLQVQGTSLRTDEVVRIEKSTEEAMPMLNEAFEKQFTNVMANELLDIEEDIRLLKLNLKTDT